MPSPVPTPPQVFEVIANILNKIKTDIMSEKTK